jgi:hypothetical protein
MFAHSYDMFVCMSSRIGMTKLLSLKIAPDAVDKVKGLAGFNGVRPCSLAEAMIRLCDDDEDFLKKCAAKAKDIESERKLAKKAPKP